MLVCIVAHCLYACMLELRRTLEIIVRTLREVVNRVRLCGHHNQRCSRGEVHVDGVDVFGGCWLVCLYAGITSHSGDHRAHSTRSELFLFSFRH